MYRRPGGTSLWALGTRPQQTPFPTSTVCPICSPKEILIDEPSQQDAHFSWHYIAPGQNTIPSRKPKKSAPNCRRWAFRSATRLETPHRGVSTRNASTNTLLPIELWYWILFVSCLWVIGCLGYGSADRCFSGTHNLWVLILYSYRR